MIIINIIYNQLETIINNLKKYIKNFSTIFQILFL